MFLLAPIYTSHNQSVWYPWNPPVLLNFKYCDPLLSYENEQEKVNVRTHELESHPLPSGPY